MRLALLGDPVEHSLSPLIHAAAMEAAGIELPAEYPENEIKQLVGYVNDFISDYVPFAAAMVIAPAPLPCQSRFPFGSSTPCPAGGVAISQW